MALLDAGVPLKNPVAGLSIGLITAKNLNDAFPIKNWDLGSHTSVTVRG